MSASTQCGRTTRQVAATQRNFGAGSRLRRRIRRGGDAVTRLRRYLILGSAALTVIWGLAGAYLILSPKRYTSAFVFVLPGTGAGASLNLVSLGQATTSSTSPFSTPDMSPTENYRKMLQGRRLLAMAAAQTGEVPEQFPPPRVDLADQTKLINIKVTGRSPGQAYDRAVAVLKAFQAMLNDLRTDEIATRDSAVRATLDGYKTALADARRALIEHEAKTGLVSVEQYSSIVTAVDKMRQALQDAEAKLAQGRGGQAELLRVMGTNADLASRAMVLRADPLFQGLVDQLAKQDTEMATLTGTRGQANPRVADLQAERASIAGRLQERIQELTGGRHPEVLHAKDLSVRDERARLMERLVSQVADNESLTALIVHLRAEIDTERARVAALAKDASRLDDLRHDVQVAEAVFSSAVARIDTSKGDFYASYPLIQTLEAPDLPERPSSPMPLLAVAGGVAATGFIVAILVITWLRVGLLEMMLQPGKRHASP